ncbi:hypothetical protein F5887DRAFT_504978 [Amanita rubescens]|nr:hypothetical protein F5887DRAFT_504978 [Amanita rubescens]
MHGTESATHRVLLCAELYHLICKNFDRQTLLALSRTCRDLKETALDLLWSEIPDFSVLIRCMPSDLWEEREIRGSRYVSLCREIRETDWHRFNTYSVRVKKLVFCPLYPFGTRRWYTIKYPYCLDAGSYRTLSHAADGMELLPRVQEIIWDTEDDDLYPYITLLLSRITYRLSLYFPHDSNLSVEERSQSQRMRFSLIRAIPSSSPHITELSLKGRGFRERSWPDVRDALDALRFWPSLQCLTLYYFPEASAVILCKIPNLRKLNLFHCDREPLLQFPLPSGWRGFPALAQLDIQYDDLEFLIPMTSITRNTPLRSLCAESSSNSTPSVDNWKQLFNLMRDGITHPSLEVVKLRFVDGDTHHMDKFKFHERPMALDAISGLLLFKNLIQLSLEATHGFDLDDEQMRNLAFALPHLEELHLRSYYPLAYWPQMTFEGLDSIAQHCLALQSLTVAFDARSIIKRSNNRGICNVNTKSFKVLDSPIDDPAAVFVYLSAIFPNLVEFSWVDYHFIPAEMEEALEPMKLKWQEVHDWMETVK